MRTKYRIAFCGVLCATLFGGTTVTVAAPAPATQCFAGHSQALVKGRQVNSSYMVILRTLQRSTKQIVEQVAAFKSDQRTPLKVIRLVLHVSGDAYQFKGKGYHGTGKLVGKPWQWHAWQSVIAFDNGMQGVSRDHFQGTTLLVQKVFTRKGTLLFSSQGRFEPKPLAFCSDKFALAKKTGVPTR